MPNSMSIDPDARRIMQELRTRWGAVRHCPEDEHAQRKTFIESNIQPFLHRSDASDEEQPVSFDQLEAFRTQLRSIKREKWGLLQDDAEDTEEFGYQETTGTQAKRRELLLEIATEQFRSGILSWLTSVNPQNEFSSSSLEELEEIERQTRYRLKVISVVQLAMERELDAIEKEVRAKRYPEPVAGNSGETGR